MKFRSFRVACQLSVAVASCVARCFGSEPEPPTVRCSLRVVTVEGGPVVGATVGVGGGLATPNAAFPAEDKGTTDGQGRFVATIGSSFGEIAMFALKPGFYETRTVSDLTSAAETVDGAFTRGRWEPWEREFELVLKRIRNPVAMYAALFSAHVPAGREWIGLDLTLKDWVAPYGRGERADLEFFADCTVEDFRKNYRGTLVVRVPGAGSGIQASEIDPKAGSALKMPYEAPIDGYAPEWTWRSSRTTPDEPRARSTFVDESFPTRGFIFRVRTVVDQAGSMTEATYGKIHPPFVFDPRGNAGAGYVSFTYYLNPDHTRYDPE